METCPSRGLKEWGFAPPSADGSPAGRLFEKSPLHPAKTFTLAAKAEGQEVSCPCRGSVFRVTPARGSGCIFIHIIIRIIMCIKIQPEPLAGVTRNTLPRQGQDTSCPSALAASVKVFAGCRGLFSKSRPAGEPSADGGAKPHSFSPLEGQVSIF